jgi:hypothetical protein
VVDAPELVSGIGHAVDTTDGWVSPSMRHSYAVEVVRNGLMLDNLRTKLELHRVIVVGRYSSQQSRLLDIDLSNMFASRDEERLCSRQQAEIFWRVGRLYIRNIGKNALRVRGRDGLILEITEEHIWRHREEILIPGGLVLTLVKEKIQ